MQVTQKMIEEIFDYVFKIPFDTHEGVITFSYTEDGGSGGYFYFSLLEPNELAGLTIPGLAMELGFSNPDGSEINFSHYPEAGRQELQDIIQSKISIGHLCMHEPMEDLVVLTLNSILPVDLVTIHNEYNLVENGDIWKAYNDLLAEWKEIFPLVTQAGLAKIGNINIRAVLQEPMGRC